MEHPKSKIRTSIEALNEQYAEWINKELKEHRLELWIDGARQYITHAESLLKGLRGLESEDDSQRKAVPSSLTQGHINASKRTRSHLNGAAETKGATSSLGTLAFDWSKGLAKGSQAAAGETVQPPSWSAGPSSTTTGFSFGQNTLGNSGGGLLGQTPQKLGTDAGTNGEAGKRPAFGGFSFGSGDTPLPFPAKRAKPEANGKEEGKQLSGAGEKPAFGGFKFPGSDSAPAFGSATKAAPFGSLNSSAANPTPAPFGGFKFGAAGGQTEEAEENDEPVEEPSEPLTRQEDPSAEIVFETKAAMHVQLDGKAWASRGKGTLTLRKPKEGPGRPYIVFASNVGQIFLNASIQQGLKPLEKDKNRVMMTLVWKEKDESEAKGRCVLMKLESLELSKQFQSEISSLAKQ